MRNSVARAVGMLYEEVADQYGIWFYNDYLSLNITSLRRTNETCDNVILEIRVNCRRS